MKNSRHWDLVVVGGANTDYLVRGKSLPEPGETLEGDSFQTAPGGKGANQAVAAARLGARVVFVGRVGRDARGEEMIASLTAEGVDTRHVVRDGHHPTGVALIMVDRQGEKLILTAPGANQHLTIADLESAAREMTSARVVLLQFEVPLPVVRRAAEMAKAAGAQVVLDPAPAPERVDKNLLRRTDVIRPNTSEARALTGVRIHDRRSARRAARMLLSQGIGFVAVQAGSRGNLLVWENGEKWLPKLPVNTIDATGAGDAFAAGLAVSLAQGKSFAEAGAFANAAAALATTKLGAQVSFPRRTDVTRLLRQSVRRSRRKQ